MVCCGTAEDVADTRGAAEPGGSSDPLGGTPRPRARRTSEGEAGIHRRRASEGELTLTASSASDDARPRRLSEGRVAFSGDGDAPPRERRLSEGHLRLSRRERRSSTGSVATASSVGDVISFRPAGKDDPAIKAAFDLIDVDGSGTITKHEVQFAMQSLGMGVDEQELMLLMQRIDSNHDDVISLAEFSKVAALRLHLLAQGIAEMRECELGDEQQRRRQRTSFIDWRRSVDKVLRGFRVVGHAVGNLGSPAGRRRSSRVADLATAAMRSSRRHSAPDSPGSPSRPGGAGGGALLRWSLGLRHSLSAAGGDEGGGGEEPASRRPPPSARAPS